MPKKAVVSNFNAMDNNKSLTYDIKTIKVFKHFFSNLAESFLAKLLDPTSKYKLEPYFFIIRLLLYLSCFTLKERQKKKFLK